MSLILAGFVKGSTAFINNPQTNLLKWIPVPINLVFDLSYPNLSREEVEEKFYERINVVKFLITLNMYRIFIFAKFHAVNLMCKIICYHLFPN